MDTSFFIAVHGGAGNHSIESEPQVRRTLRRSCKSAIEGILVKYDVDTATAVVLAEDAIAQLEDDKNLNAGYGSNLTQAGTVECDASIMDSDGHFGSVGAVSGITNPIKVASLLSNRSRIPDVFGRVHPLLLVSSGVRDFAAEQSVSTSSTDNNAKPLIAPPETLISDRAKHEWSYWKSRIEKEPDSIRSEINQGHRLEDTVGGVVMIRQHSSSDSAERANMAIAMAAGVSSGGILLKLPGRIGEAAIYGAGCWASSHVAVSVSGTGEQIIRTSLAKVLGEAIESCLLVQPPQDADDTDDNDIHTVIERIFRDNFCGLCDKLGAGDPQAGAIILVQDVTNGPNGSQSPEKARLFCVFTTESMAIGYASWNSRRTNIAPKSTILRRVAVKSSNSDQQPHIFITAYALE